MKTSVTTMIVGAGSAQISAGTVRDLCVNPGLHDIPQITFFLEVARDKERPVPTGSVYVPTGSVSVPMRG